VATLACPVVANGNIVDEATALAYHQKTQAAGLMVGRGAIRNPWIFDQLRAAFEGSPKPQPTHRDLLAYVEHLYAEIADSTSKFSPTGHVQRMKRTMGYISHGLTPDFEFNIRRCQTPVEFWAICRAHLDHDTPLPLFAYWYWCSGSFQLNSYAIPRANNNVEGFHWANPEIYNFLFSVDRGLFFWAPTILIGFLGIPILIKRDKLLGSLVAVVLCLHIYICSSWWAWWFGASFGSRPFVDMMPVLAIPLTFSVIRIKQVIGVYGTALLTVFLTGTSLMLMYSYWLGFIPFSGTTLEILTKLPSKFGY
jgi:hypothetical protein